MSKKRDKLEEFQKITEDDKKHFEEWKKDYMERFKLTDEDFSMLSRHDYPDIAVAQQTRLDELLAKLNSSGQDTERIRLIALRMSLYHHVLMRPLLDCIEKFSEGKPFDLNLVFEIIDEISTQGMIARFSHEKNDKIRELTRRHMENKNKRFEKTEKLFMEVDEALRDYNHNCDNLTSICAKVFDRRRAEIHEVYPKATECSFEKKYKAWKKLCPRVPPFSYALLTNKPL